MPDEASTLPLPSDVFSAQALKQIDPKSPAGARMFAAKGLGIPTPREAMSALYVLTFDEDAKIAETARTSAAKLPEKLISNLRDEELHPKVLAFYAGMLAGNAQALEIIALNVSTPDEVIAEMAANVPERIAEIISQNQLRVLRDDRIVRGLVRNPNIRLATLDTLLDFCVRSGQAMADLPEYQAARTRVFGADPVVAAQIIKAEQNTVEKVVSEVGAGVTDESAVLDDSKRLTFTQRVMQMSVSQKIKLASLGNKEARTLLLRDSNKLVAMAAVTSPRMTEQEVIGLSNNRTLNDEVMRFIANNREWTKLYQIKLNLVSNPKCPQGIALRMMQHLHVGDIKTLSRNKNIATAISTNARRMMSAKSDKAG